MARKNKNGFGTMLLVSAAAAVAGGVAAYLRRKELEGMVQNIADALDAREEDGFFSVDLGEEPVFHKVPMDPETAPEAETPDQPAEAEECDFADGGEAAPADEPAPEGE